MSHKLELTVEACQEIDSKLPKFIADLKHQFPATIYALAENWHLEPLPEAYEPESIDIYYKDEQLDQAGLSVTDGLLTFVDVREPLNEDDQALIFMAVDDLPAYISIGSMVIFNRLGGAILPDVIVNPSKLAEVIVSNWPNDD